MPHSLSFDTPAPGGWRIGIAAAAVAALLSACKPAVESAQAMSGPQEAAVVSVQVARVVERNAAPESTHLARVEAAERVEIRPRVGGQVIAVLFREGEMVSAGQALFRLDPRPFDIAVDKAEAVELALRTTPNNTPSPIRPVKLPYNANQCLKPLSPWNHSRTNWYNPLGTIPTCQRASSAASPKPTTPSRATILNGLDITAKPIIPSNKTIAIPIAFHLGKMVAPCLTLAPGPSLQKHHPKKTARAQRCPQAPLCLGLNV